MAASADLREPWKYAGCGAVCHLNHIPPGKINIGPRGTLRLYFCLPVEGPLVVVMCKNSYCPQNTNSQVQLSVPTTAFFNWAKKKKKFLRISLRARLIKAWPLFTAKALQIPQQLSRSLDVLKCKPLCVPICCVWWCVTDAGDAKKKGHGRGCWEGPTWAARRKKPAEQIVMMSAVRNWRWIKVL